MEGLLHQMPYTWAQKMIKYTGNAWKGGGGGEDKGCWRFWIEGCNIKYEVMWELWLLSVSKIGHPFPKACLGVNKNKTSKFGVSCYKDSLNTFSVCIENRLQVCIKIWLTPHWLFYWCVVPEKKSYLSQRKVLDLGHPPNPLEIPI